MLLCSVTRSCPLLCNPRNCIPPVSSVRGVFQTRTLEWVAISFSKASSQPRDQTWVSHTSCFSGQSLSTAPLGKACKGGLVVTWHQPGQEEPPDMGRRGEHDLGARINLLPLLSLHPGYRAVARRTHTHTCFPNQQKLTADG